MRKTTLCALLLCGLVRSISSQQESENPFIYGFDNSSAARGGQELFPFFDLYSGGVCRQYAGACSALVEDFTFFDKNPAASSLIYSGPFIGFSHRNYLIDDSVESVAFAHSVNRVGFGGVFRYAQSILNSYNASGAVENIFSPNELLFGLNISYNLLRSGLIDGISVGMNIKGAFTIFPEVNEPVISRGAVLLDLGTLVNFHALKMVDFARPNLSLGLSYRNLGITLVRGKQPDPAGLSVGVLTLGFAYLPIPYLLISSDLELAFTAIEQSPLGDAFDFSVGLGVMPVDFLELGAGFHINSTEYFFTVGASVTILGTQIRFVQRIDAFSDIASFSNFTISISLKVQNTVSSDRQQSVQKIYLSALQALLAEDLETATSLVNQLLIIAPGYGPAREMQEQIRSLRRVNQLL